MSYGITAEPVAMAGGMGALHWVTRVLSDFPVRESRRDGEPLQSYLEQRRGSSPKEGVVVSKRSRKGYLVVKISRCPLQRLFEGKAGRE